MATGTMGVAVFTFLFTGLADFDDIHIKCQLLPGQRVVAIDINVEAADFKYGYLNRALLGLQVQYLAF